MKTITFILGMTFWLGVTFYSQHAKTKENSPKFLAGQIVTFRGFLTNCTGIIKEYNPILDTYEVILSCPNLKSWEKSVFSSYIIGR